METTASSVRRCRRNRRLDDVTVKSRIFASVTLSFFAIRIFILECCDVERVSDIDVSLKDTERSSVSIVLGIGVGTFEGQNVGNALGRRVGDPVGAIVGGDDGEIVGSAVGTKVGTGVGGRVYSTTIVLVVTVVLAVAFWLAVMLIAVIFPLAEVSAAVRLPELAEASISSKNVLVRF